MLLVPCKQVKGGGAVPPKGTSYSLTVTSKDDFQRDVLKSDTAVLELPQLELVMEMGTLGSMYTTIEGLLSKVGEISIGAFHRALVASNLHDTCNRFRGPGGGSGDKYQPRHGTLVESEIPYSEVYIPSPSWRGS